MAEESKHKKFLYHFIETRNVAESARLAGIDNPATLQTYFSQYKNYYKALFEKLEMPEESVLIELKNVMLTEKGNVKLKAIEMILKLMGALEEKNASVEINVSSNDNKENEIRIYNKIKSDPVLSEKMLSLIDEQSRTNH